MLEMLLCFRNTCKYNSGCSMKWQTLVNYEEKSKYASTRMLGRKAFMLQMYKR
jgi:hypothetical protein